jgi:hypothetical protein
LDHTAEKKLKCKHKTKPKTRAICLEGGVDKVFIYSERVFIRQISK